MNAEKAVGGVVLGIGLASLGMLALAARRLTLLERAVDPADIVVLSVFAVFGSLCAVIGWRLLRAAVTATASQSSPTPHATSVPPRRVTISRACAAAGVLLLMLSVLVPAAWHPVVLLFLGLALLAVSHGLTPCVERLEQLRKARASERQL
jgi:hypothetical protein